MSTVAGAEREHARLLRSSIDGLPARVALVDRAGRLLVTNSAWSRQFQKVGHAGGDGCVEALRSALKDDDASAACRGIADLIDGGRDGFRAVYNRCNRWFQLSASRFRFKGDPLAVVVLEDVTEARVARQEARHLSHQLMELQEIERQRIASELHDSTFQHLVGMSLNLMRLHEGLGEPQLRILEEVNKGLAQVMQEVRVFSYLLYPTDLRTDGLRTTLQDFVQGFERRTGLRTILTARRAIDNLPLELQHCALRVVQEALLNAYKHAGATRLSVNAKMVQGALVLRIHDNGRGISKAAESATGDGARLGVGIPAMRARIRYFGGSLVIRSKRDGTTVLATIAVPASTSADADLASPRRRSATAH